MKVEYDFDGEFGPCAPAVRKLLKKLGHNPVDSTKLLVGMRVVEQDHPMKSGIIIVFSQSGEVATVAFDYYTARPRLKVIEVSRLKAHISR